MMRGNNSESVHLRCLPRRGLLLSHGEQETIRRGRGKMFPVVPLSGNIKPGGFVTGLALSSALIHGGALHCNKVH